MLTHTSAVSWRRIVNATWSAPANFTGRVVFRATLVEEYRVRIFPVYYMLKLSNDKFIYVLNYPFTADVLEGSDQPFHHHRRGDLQADDAERGQRGRRRRWRQENQQV